MNMIKINSLVLLPALAVMVSVPGCSDSRKTSQVVGSVPAPMRISGISPGMSKDEVVGLLGQPERQESSDGLRMYHYPKVIIGIDEYDDVAFIGATEKSSCILASVCLGSNIKAIRKELYDGDFSHVDFDGSIVINGDGCWGEVKFDSNIASDVSILCSP